MNMIYIEYKREDINHTLL